MGYKVKTTVACDRCGEGWEYRAYVNKSQAQYMARERGWTVGKRWLCPTCRKAPKKSKEAEPNE